MFKVYTRAIILNNNWEVLLLKKTSSEKYGSDRWVYPGGTVEFWEDVEITLARELQEEIGVKIRNLQLFDQRKMMIWDEHWVGLYYIVDIIWDPKNIESGKHQELRWMSLKDIPVDMLHSHLVKYLQPGFTHMRSFDIYTSNPDLHTMGQHLDKYITIKMHNMLYDEQYESVRVVGKYDPCSRRGVNEKNDKLFNYKRPTAYVDDNVLFIECFPWEDYVKHYASLIKSHFLMIGSNQIAENISYQLPEKTYIQKTLQVATNILTIPVSDYVVLGMVEQLCWSHGWAGWEGEFLWKHIHIPNNKTITYIGCKFSFWGDISGYVVDTLAKLGAKYVVYVWKLWAIHTNMPPNTSLATWNSSSLEGEVVYWNNLFSKLVDENIFHGKHVTSHSIISEDKSWRKKHLWYDFVDPEIGHMARMAQKNWIQFSYLHIISNTLGVITAENLSNERSSLILQKRANLYGQIQTILIDTFSKLS